MNDVPRPSGWETEGLKAETISGSDQSLFSASARLVCLPPVNLAELLLRAAAYFLPGGRHMVVIRTPDGATVEYRLRRTGRCLRAELQCTSYDLATMIQDAGWQIVGVRTFVARRLLLHAGLLTPSAEQLPLSRWRTRRQSHVERHSPSAAA
jgi:hypothetical protein